MYDHFVSQGHAFFFLVPETNTEIRFTGTGCALSSVEATVQPRTIHLMLSLQL